MINLVKLRKKQPAFHPNATQFTLQLEKIFLVYGDKALIEVKVSFVLVIYPNKKKISLLDINLISTEKWYDILSKKKITEIEGNITLLPYQSMWITNKKF